MTLTDFDIDLTDFQQHSLEDSIIVGELYKRNKSPVLRFFSKNKKRDIASEINLEEENSDAAAQQCEKRQFPDTSATDAVEINTSDLIYVGRCISICKCKQQKRFPSLHDNRPN